MFNWLGCSDWSWWSRGWNDGIKWTRWYVFRKVIVYLVTGIHLQCHGCDIKTSGRKGAVRKNISYFPSMKRRHLAPAEKLHTNVFKNFISSHWELSQWIPSEYFIQYVDMDRNKAEFWVFSKVSCVAHVSQAGRSLLKLPAKALSIWKNIQLLATAVSDCFDTFLPKLGSEHLKDW